MKTPVKNYFSLTKTEWNGMVILVVLIVAALTVPYIYAYLHHDQPVDFKDFDRSVALLKQAGVEPGGTGEDNMDEEEGPVIHISMFRFNPNKITIAGWQKLGLSKRQIKGIKNYQAKGGQFRTKADVKKMYTLTDADYKRLEPYIGLPAADSVKHSRIVAELNSADSAQLTRLDGLWPSLAKRIVHYRQRLGGFYQKSQLKEVYGIDQEKYQQLQPQLKVDATKVKKIRINSCEFEDIKNFPYLSFKQMNAIIQYRKQHGNYDSVNELKNIAILDEELLRKIRPYLSVN